MEVSIEHPCRLVANENIHVHELWTQAEKIEQVDKQIRLNCHSLSPFQVGIKKEKKNRI
jgi:hypothetical protein